MVPLLAMECAHGSGESAVETAQHVDSAASLPAAELAGARCQDGHCRCRELRDNVETVPPAADHKRFEIRMSVAAGEIVLTSPTLGRLHHDGRQEACFYVDLPAGSSHEFVIKSREAQKGQGLTPLVRIAASILWASAPR